MARGLGGQVQQAGEQIEAQFLQQALAEHALANIDEILEAAIDQHQQEEQAGQGQQIVQAVQRHPFKQLDASAAKPSREGQAQVEQHCGRDPVGKSAALQHIADNVFGQVEREIVEWKGRERDQEDLDLRCPAVAPDI